MAKTGNTPEAARNCETQLADYLQKAIAMLKQNFKDAQLRDFEARADALASRFESLRIKMGNARDYDGAASATSPLEKELDTFEAAFEKWYDEEAEDLGFFAHTASIFLDIRLRLEAYRGGLGTLGEAGANPEKAKEICGKLNGEIKSAVQKYDMAAQKAAAMAKTQYEKDSAGRIADSVSTILRYLDLSHESCMLEADERTGPKEGALGKALRLTGSAQGQYSGLRAHAFHQNNEELQEAAAEASFAFFAYIGALCALFSLSDAGQEGAFL